MRLDVIDEKDTRKGKLQVGCLGKMARINKVFLVCTCHL